MYVRSGSRYRVAKSVEVLDAAAACAAQQIEKDRPAVGTPEAAFAFLVGQLGHCQEEYFCVLYLDTHHRVIAFEKMFRGTIDGASVHPREVLKGVLERHAASVILAHNHPSGSLDPSSADESVTRRVRKTLELIDVRVLDHIIVGGERCFSFSQAGLI